MDSPNPHSKVLHFRNVPSDATEEDISAIVQPFGAISVQLLMRGKHQALVEMADIRQAITLVQYFITYPCNIRGTLVEVQFSKHQMLDRRPDSNSTQNHGHSGLGTPNRILLTTVHDPAYPITVDVIEQVFGPHGALEKVVIFSKPVGLQVLVQYNRLESAQQALEALQNQYIYQNVCRLEIQYSRLQDLTITSNNETRRDFTNPNLPNEPPGLLPTPPSSASPPGHSTASPHFQNIPQHHLPARAQGAGAAPTMFGSTGFGLSNGLPALGAGLGDQANGGGVGCVLLAHNLHEEKTTCQSLFNLFSNYGNVVRIKRFYNKLDHALIQMQEPFHANSALQHLKRCVVFGKPLHVRMSKHRYINPGPNPIEDPESDEAQEALSVGYARSKLNRFRGSAASKALRPGYDPSETVHLSNLADDTTEDMLQEAFAEFGPMEEVKMFEASDHLMCLMTFASIEMATDALCLMHNQLVNGKHIRVAFSRPKSSRNP